jgi:hypothetical protein
MASSYSPRIITDGLQFAMDPANPKSYPGSGTTMYDLSGNGYNGTINGTSTVSGGYLDLGTVGNVTNYLTIPADALDGLTAWTIELWLYIHATNAIDTFLTCGAGNDFLWYFNTRSSIYHENTGVSSATYATSLTTPFLFTATGTGGVTKVYKNGVYVGGPNNTTSITVNSEIGIVLGQEQDSNTTSFDTSQSFRGKYGPVKFYSRVLSDAEITQNYNATKGRFGL